MFQCFQTVDVGCNLKCFDGLTWLTWHPYFTTDLRHLRPSYTDCDDLCSVSFVGRELVARIGIRAVEGLSLEWISKNLYFTDNNRYIGVIRLRSQHFQDVLRLVTNLGNPRAIVMNPYVGYKCVWHSLVGGRYDCRWHFDSEISYSFSQFN